MSQAKLKVKIIEHTPNPEKVVAMAAKLCYSPTTINELEEKLDKENIEKFINILINMKHESPVEHVSFTFTIEGVSRITEQQLTRHRIGASYSIQSGRYVNRKNLEYVVPPEIEKIPKAFNLYLNKMIENQNIYNDLVKLLIQNGRTKKQAIEDARYIYPQGLSTKIIVTMNLRELLHFFNKRCCNRSQWEIRELANEMLKQCKNISPILFRNAGKPCIKGICYEGNMQCSEMKDIIPIK